MSLETSLTADIIVVALCSAVLIRRGGLRHSHPAVIYIVFHLIVFSLRAWALTQGAEPTLGLTPSESARALNYADLFLISLTLGWLSAPTFDHRVNRSARYDVTTRSILIVAFVALPIGLYSLATQAYFLGEPQGRQALATSYQVVAVAWPGLILVALIYKLGFRWYLLVPLAPYLLLMGLQGQSRYRVILPLIFLVQIWMDKRGRKWPTLKISAILIVALALFILSRA